MGNIESIANIAVERHETLLLIDECIREIMAEIKAALKDKAEKIHMKCDGEKNGIFVFEFVDKTIEITYKIIDEKLQGGKKGKNEVKNALLDLIMSDIVEVNIPTGF